MMIYRFLRNTLTVAAIFIAVAMTAVSCSDDDEPAPLASPGGEASGQELPTDSILGAFTFDGDSIPIVTANFSETSAGSDSEGYYTFEFSPKSPDSVPTTRLVISIRKYWGDGKEHAVGGLDLFHNDDYMIVYEDPAHYYSQYRKPQGGSFLITVPTDRNGWFSVQADVQLADGKPLAVEYEGTFNVVTE